MVHLTPMIQREEIEVWWDGHLQAGDEWEHEIFTKLENADVILLLVSPDFLASDFVWRKELPQAMIRLATGAIVIPIMLKQIAHFRIHEISKLQALPNRARPVSDWEDPEDAYRDITESIRRKILPNGDPPPDNPPPPDDTEGPYAEHTNVPKLLPYLCDRGEQEKELTKALASYVKKTPRKPFVCIVHGNDSECHAEFVERTQRTAINQALGLDAKAPSPEPHVFPWPSHAVQFDRYVEVFSSNLGHELVRNSSASFEDIISKCITMNERTIVLISIVFTRNFGKSPEKLLEAFLEFCQRWPNLPPGRSLIHFVCIKHERFEDSGLFERWKMRKVSDQLRRLITPDLLSRAGVEGIVLSELQGIQLSDAVEWKLKEEVRKVRDIDSGDIRYLYQRPELIDSQRLISMERLAGELRTLLSKSIPG